jgi:hypothetical protein
MSHEPNRLPENQWQSLPETRHWENMHIPLWLLKDTCWMVEWKYLGVTMIIPTILMAIFILYKSRGYNEFWVNLAICFWITANSFWMCAEFFDFEEYKNMAGIPFGLGMVAVTVFYIGSFRVKSKS